MAYCRLILSTVLLLLVMTTGPVGCTTWATYPPIEGAAQIGHPKLEPTPTILADAIRYVHDRHGEGELVFNLPEGAPNDLYDILSRRLRDSRPMQSDDELAIHIQQIRIRANTAEVDVIYPRPGGHHELVTLYMRQRFMTEYRVTGTRLWRVRVDVPRANYTPPAAQPAGQDEAAESSASPAPAAPITSESSPDA